MTVAPDPLVAVPAPLAVREVRHLTLVRSTPVFEQGALSLTYPMPTGLDAVPTGADDGSFAASGSPAVPSPQPWAARYVQAVVEVLARQRPVSQLARWTSAEVYRDLTRLQRVAAQPREAPTRPPRQAVVSVRVCAVAPDAAEVAARITEGQRSRAIAARLDFRRGRWTCTALAVG
jgi:hypothetical protein